jgi:hypothetical protein
LALLGVVLAGLVVLLVRPDGTEPDPVTDTRPVAWSVGFETIDRIAIELRSSGSGQAWIKGGDGDWYFEGPGRTKVDDERWGGGIPLLVSGPVAQRLIAENASAAQLAIYGFAAPQMRVRLTVADNAPIEIEVGDRTPDGSADYVRVADAPTVYAIHHAWKDVLARLVLDPPVARE